MAPKAKRWWQQDVPTWVALVGGVVALVAGGYGVYQAFVKDMPEIKQGIQAIQKQLGEAEGRQKELAMLLVQEQTSRARADSSIRVLQTNMIAVIQKIERRQLKPAELREIMANVQDVSKAEASELGPPTVSGAQPGMPPALIAFAERYQPEFAATLKNPGKANITEGVFAKAMLTRNAKWEALGGGIKVYYEGGSAYFAAKYGMSNEDLRKRAELYNSLSRAILLTTGDLTPQFIKKPLAPTERDSAPQMRTPDVPRLLEGPPAFKPK